MSAIKQKLGVFKAFRPFRLLVYWDIVGRWHDRWVSDQTIECITGPQRQRSFSRLGHRIRDELERLH